MAQAVALGEEARGTTAPNPNVGCIIATDSYRLVVVGRGNTAELFEAGRAGCRWRGIP